jgi:hypothetical protein
VDIRTHPDSGVRKTPSNLSFKQEEKSNVKDIQLADVTVHIDEDVSDEQRVRIENALRALDGVVSVHMPSDKRHLIVVEYDAEVNHSQEILRCVRQERVHAVLVGL